MIVSSVFIVPPGTGAYFGAMEGLGHFPMSEDPVRFRHYIAPVLDQIRQEPGGSVRPEDA